MNNREIRTALRTRGFGLVEIMVGMVIGLVGMLVIMQVYSVFDSQKRATTSGGDAQTNGVLALYLMEREIRVAGNGMTEGEPQKYAPLAGCTTAVYDAGGPIFLPNATSPFESTKVAAGTVRDVRLAPVVVSDGGGGASDALTVIYGDSMVAAPYALTAGFSSGDPAIGVKSVSGIARGDMVALIERDKVLTTNANYIIPTRCSLLQVSATPAAGSVPVATGRYNPTGAGITYTDDAQLFNLGRLNIVTYRISGNDLVADVSRFGNIPDGGAGTPVTNAVDYAPLASNIVNMQVQYGIDTGNPMGAIQSDCKTQSPGISLQASDADAIVDAWVDATGPRWTNNPVAGTPSVTDLRRIRAIRIGLVARSGIKATGKPGDLCNATAPVIDWDTGPDMAPDLSSDPDWQCYRYKTFQAVIPVRNALWSSTMNPASAATCGLRDAS